MNGLWKLRPWLDLSEAARYLSESTGTSIDDKSILRSALDGQIKLSVHFSDKIPAIRIMREDADQTMEEKDPSEVPLTKETIDGLWDVVLEGKGREEIEQKYQRAKGSSSSRLTSAGGTFLVGEGGQRYQVSPGINPMFADVSKLTHDGKLVVKREELDAFATLVREQAPQEVSQEADTRPLDKRELVTLLVIIAALAKELDIDWTDAYKAAQSIAVLTEQLGAPVSDQTIEKKLNLISDALERRSISP